VRRAAKRIAYLAATVVVLPALASHWLRARLLGADRALHGSSQWLALVPGLCGQYLRRAFYTRTLASFHWTATVEFGTLLSKAAARIGEDVYIGPMCHLGLVDIGRDSLLASGVQIPSGSRTHGFSDPGRPIRAQEGQLVCVSIGRDVWIGAGAVVMADVGDGTIVGSGAVVLERLPPRVIAGGVPARVLKARDDRELAP